MTDQNLLEFSLSSKKLRDQIYPRVQNSWPDSIKEDFVKLIDAGADQNKLIGYLGISETTMKNWFYQVRKKIEKEKKGNTFKEVTIAADKKCNSTFTLKFPTGSILENISIEDLVLLKTSGIL